jgi:PsbP-like protein
MARLKFILPVTCFIGLVSVLYLVLLWQVGNAVQTSLTSSDSIIKTLVKDATIALGAGNATKSLQNLNVVHQMLLDSNTNSSSFMATELLINDAIEAIRGNDSSRAVVYLNLVQQQFGIPVSTNESAQTEEKEISAGISNSSNFLSYVNPTLGVTMQYPRDWTAHQYEYNPGANNTLVGFYSPSKTASELGNISGVSGHFVPYADIFVFDSKNMTLDKIIEGKIKRLQNDTHFSIIESKPIALKAGQPGYVIIYKTVAGGDELFQKIQAYTIRNNKVYLITFTSQEASFSSYLPTAQKMISSFEVKIEK